MTTGMVYDYQYYGLYRIFNLIVVFTQKLFILKLTNKLFLSKNDIIFCKFAMVRCSPRLLTKAYKSIETSTINNLMRKVVLLTNCLNVLFLYEKLIWSSRAPFLAGVIECNYTL